MESWEGQDYYTTDPAKWIHLMNLSTQEWGIGPLPFPIIAINGSLANEPNATSKYNSSTYIIVYAGQALTDGYPTEKLVFIVTTVIAVVVLGIWLWVNWKSLFKPLGRSHSERATATNGTVEMLPRQGGGGGDQESTLGSSTFIDLGDLRSANNVSRWADMKPPGAGMSAGRFDYLMRHYFYPPFVTEVEIYEKGSGDAVEVEDVERMTELVRKMLAADNSLWNNAANVRFTNEVRRGFMHRGDDALMEVAMGVRGWGETGWPREERGKVAEIERLVEETRWKRQQG
ncbi:hypothetical protein B0T14DRAFT_590332 [Immersiella caudata]|uniref:Uncharacterized protein n=1 Tax=Immersiella caudata TaxID=314043 RepID=A0AA39WLH4_9PEZI|nr:hypothetical protein B0T14DRAFT_590332 [Immersiella caudata]